MEKDKIWLEYDNKLFLIREEPMDSEEMEDEYYAFSLELSGVWPFQEVLKGSSGVTQYGSHGGRISESAYDLITQHGIPWTEEEIEKRLRYSIRDGGTMLETFVPKINPIDSMSKFFKKKFNIK